MQQQFGLSQYMDISHQNSYNNQSIMSYHSQHNLHPKLNFFQKRHDENQPQLDSCPLSLQKDEEPTQEKDLGKMPPVGNLINPDKQVYFDSQKVRNYKKCFQGSRNDTMELNINFKTLLLSHFKELNHLKQLSPSDLIAVDKFKSSAPSFYSLKAFYKQRQGNEAIRSKCLDFLQSKSCIIKILSGRCRLRNKIMMIKFIEKMKKNLNNKDEIIRWKDTDKLEIKSQ